MLILTHVILALASVVVSGLSYIWPSQTRLNITYGLVAGTLASGTYLVASTSSALVPACISGLTYLGIVSICILGARYKMAAIRNTNK